MVISSQTYSIWALYDIKEADEMSSPEQVRTTIFIPTTLWQWIISTINAGAKQHSFGEATFCSSHFQLSPPPYVLPTSSYFSPSTDLFSPSTANEIDEMVSAIVDEGRSSDNTATIAGDMKATSLRLEAAMQELQLKHGDA